MTGTAAIQLDQLPPPDVIEALDFESIYASARAALAIYWPDYTNELESEPTNKVLQAMAYMAMNLRQRINDAARACMLATAERADLDNLGALVGVQRLVVAPADDTTGTPAVMESDDAFRARIVLAPSGYSVAGPADAYVFHALSADGGVLDASATSTTPDDVRVIVMGVLSDNSASQTLIDAMTAALDAAKWPGDVLVSVLANAGDGTADATLLATVESAVSATDVRPMTDNVTVASAEIVPYTVDATIYTYAGPDPAVILATARTRLDAYIAAMHRLGMDVTRSGIFAALHIAGVQRVQLDSPAANVVISDTQASHCTGVTINDGGVDE